MKKKLPLLPLTAAVLLTGCKGLLPGSVEYFQDKVEAIPPHVSEAGLERQKQAAKFLAERTKETQAAAIQTGADVSVIVPATESAVVSQSLSVSMGPPMAPTRENPTNLAAALEKDRAKQDKKIDDAREDQAENEGKAIEGTGLFEFGFFTQWGFIVGFLLIGYVILRIYSAINPVVGAGLGVTRKVSAAILAKGFSGTAEAIESFKAGLAAKKTYSADEIKMMLRNQLQARQDSDVQRLLRDLTPKK